MDMPLSTDKQRFLFETLESKDILCEPMAGDASSREYIRVKCREHSWVLMQMETFAENTPFLCAQAYFHNAGVHVPSIKAMCPELGLILLTDLGDTTLCHLVKEKNELSQMYYEQAIVELIKIHSKVTELEGF